MAAEEAAELSALRAGCTRFLTGHGEVRAADLLATIAPDTEVDRYGDGGVVVALEAEIARLLGKPAAVFLPSGTMAQQIVLRVHADHRQRRTVIFHPMCHLERHEGQAYQRLHGLTGRPVGDQNRLITLPDLTAVAEPVAALLIELPQRDIGGQQPSLAALAGRAARASRGSPGGPSGGSKALGVGSRLRPPARRDRGTVRHRVRVVLQGHR